jgi:DNA-binding transcriptional LysR family regulator
VNRLLVCSPSYLENKRPVIHPSDLEEWDWIRFVMRPAKTELMSKTGEEINVVGRSNLSVNSADSLYELAARGMGVTAIPENLACRGFERGDLVHVLPDWSLRPLGMHVIWPNQARRENLTLLFVRFLADSQRKKKV